MNPIWRHTKLGEHCDYGVLSVSIVHEDAAHWEMAAYLRKGVVIGTVTSSERLFTMRFACEGEATAKIGALARAQDWLVDNFERLLEPGFTGDWE